MLNPRFISLSARAIALAATAAALVAVSGCNILGPAAYFMAGPAKTKRLYTLDAKRPTVIFVDDRSNKVPRRATRLMIAQEAEKVLAGDRAVQTLVSAQSAMVAASQDKSERSMAISEIGRSVSAEVVVYATVDFFSLTPDGTRNEPSAQLRVKVIDAMTDKRLWPEEPNGAPLRVSLPSKTSDLPTNTAARFAAEDELARQTGRELAWLFVDHIPEKTLKAPGE